jgi:hypothetical protein
VVVLVGMLVAVLVALVGMLVALAAVLVAMLVVVVSERHIVHVSLIFINTENRWECHSFVGGLLSRPCVLFTLSLIDTKPV